MRKRQAVKELSPRDKAISEVRELHAEMREQIIASGIQAEEADAPLTGLDELTTEAIENLATWLTALKSDSYALVMATYSLREPQYWENLVSLFGQHNTREQKDLKRARRSLRIAWRKRHGKPANGNTEEAETPVDDGDSEDAQ